MAYVSITGLRLKGIRHAPRFWWHAIRSMTQARKASGILKAEARLIDGVHHTMTVWASKKEMQQFLRAGAHVKAMKIFRFIATGRVAGFEAEAAPDWSEVPEILRLKGRDV